MTMTPNGSLYTRKKQGFLPALMEKMYTDRVKYKKMMIEEQKKGKSADPNKLAQYHNMQINLKIALNSAYGALGNQWFRSRHILISVKEAGFVLRSRQQNHPD